MGGGDSVNALEIVDAVRRCGADLVVADGQLRVRGTGAPLAAELRDEIRAHKAELLVALGEPMDRTVGAILADVRPYLAPALRELPTGQLVALVNWNIIAAWNKAMRELGPDVVRDAWDDALT